MGATYEVNSVIMDYNLEWRRKKGIWSYLQNHKVQALAQRRANALWKDYGRKPIENRQTNLPDLRKEICEVSLPGARTMNPIQINTEFA